MRVKGTHFTHETKKQKRTKSIVLSIVALLELILLISSFTFSWFEGLTSLELHGENFKTAAALNSHVELGENISTTDNTYSQIIDLEPFFDAQNEVRLSPVSSADGVNFYAAYDGTPIKSNYTSLHYRKLSKEDINSNIIQFEFNISSPDGPMDVYFTEVMPIVYIDGTARVQGVRYANPYRYAFSDGTTTTIFRTEDYVGSAANAAHKQIAIKGLNADDTPITTDKFIRRPHEFTYYSDHREEVLSQPMDSDTGVMAPINPLFHLDMGQTKTITVSVWMEALDYECLNPGTTSNPNVNTPNPGQNISFAVKLCTTWSIYREITVYDYTADQWIDDKDDSNIDTALYVRSTDGKDNNNRQYELTYDATDKKWTGNIPVGINNCEFLWGTKGNDRVATSYATWTAAGRGNSTEITMLGSSACVWDLTPDELTKIDFRDYTTGNWINNKDDKGNDIDLAVGITYDGKILDYSMTSSPTQDSFGKNSWSCWIPSTVDTVKFYRRGFDTSNTYVDFNYWIGNDRGDETVYRAVTESDGNTGTDSSFVLYVKIDDAIADAFYANNRGKSPAISFTGNANRNLWDTTSNKTTISRFDYHPNQDTWPNGESELTKVPGVDNLWYMAFDEKPTDGTFVTVWSRSGANNFNDVDTDMCFGVFYLFEANKNYTTINVTTAQKLISTGASNNYALLGTMDQSGAGAGSGGTATGSLQTGVWGELSAPEEGTYDTTFIHTSDVASVKVTFTYDGAEFTMDMTKGDDGRTWTTRAVPNAVTSGISFTDSNGNTWTDTGTDTTRSMTRRYFYAITANGSNSTGTGWRRLIGIDDGATSYFKHYNTSITTVTATFTYEDVPFTINLTKGSDNLTWSTSSIPDDVTSVKYSDGTHTWNVTGKNTSVPYCYALDGDQYELKATANFARIYLERNYNWSDIKIYFTGTGAPTWNNRPAMTNLGRNLNSSPLYCYLVPTDAGLIIFTGTENGATKQTVDLTSNHKTDLRVFRFSSWDSSQNKANCSNSAISASSLN